MPQCDYRLWGAYRFLVTILFVALSGSVSAQFRIKSTKVPRFDEAVRRGVDFLVNSTEVLQEDEAVLVAYALLKAGLPVDHPLIARGMESARERAISGSYARVGYDHIYIAGVDSMLLADSDAEAHFQHLQNIASYVESVQRSDGSWTDTISNSPGDVSMTQYGVLALWSAQRAKCRVSPSALERCASYLMGNANGDGGWGYRPGTTLGPGGGKTTHNMAVAGAGSLAVARTLIHGRKNKPKEAKPKDKFGVLKKQETASAIAAQAGSSFPSYKPQTNPGTLDGRIERALRWNNAVFTPVSRDAHKIYYYYALERAAALSTMPRADWFTVYGDGLLTLQGNDGSWNTHSGEEVGTAFAILYYMRSTKQILDKLYGSGTLSSGSGLDTVFGSKKKSKKIGQLDELLGAIENVDLDSLENFDAVELVESVQFGSKEDLIGQVDQLRKLLKSKNADHRRAAYFALGRTGDFKLIPEMIRGLRDENLDVNVEALQALRYISRKPNGFGLPLNPVEKGLTKEAKLKQANRWRTKAFKTWGNWYRRIRPYEEGDGLDELELLSPE